MLVGVVAAAQRLSATGVIASGGTVTEAGIDGFDYRIHTLVDGGTFTLTDDGGASFDALLVAGGGSGGTGASATAGAGGGGGGVLYEEGFTLTPGAHAITVGAGGLGITAANTRGNDGGDTVASGLTAEGGGGGGSGNAAPNIDGKPGGSGGGGGRTAASNGGAGTAGQGHDGGAGHPDTSVNSNQAPAATAS